MKTNDFIEDNLIVTVAALITLAVVVIFGLAHYEQRTYANDRKELFVSCVGAGGKPESCLGAAMNQGSK